MFRLGRVGLISLFVLLVSATPAVAGWQGTADQPLNGTRGQADVRPPGASFTPFGPVRIVDSRIALGVASGLRNGKPATFQVAGVLGIPAGAVAVSGNLTVTNEDHNGYVSLTTDPTKATMTSTLNISKGDVRANGVFVALSSTGMLSATAVGMNCAIVFDVTGYFTDDDTQSSWYPLVPARVLDTRVNIGLTGKFVHQTPRALQVAGFGGVPVGATAITANLTTVNSTGSSWVAVTVTPTPHPSTSTLNFPAGDIRANNLVAPLADDGSIALTYNGAGSTDLILDVTGYFMQDNDGGLFVPLDPYRVMDSGSTSGCPVRSPPASRAPWPSPAWMASTRTPSPSRAT